MTPADLDIAREVAGHYDRIAWIYEISDWSHEVLRYRKLRPILGSYAKGRTLDLGVGSGLRICTLLSKRNPSDGRRRPARECSKRAALRAKLVEARRYLWCS